MNIKKISYAKSTSVVSQSRILSNNVHIGQSHDPETDTGTAVVTFLNAEGEEEQWRTQSLRRDATIEGMKDRWMKDFKSFDSGEIIAVRFLPDNDKVNEDLSICPGCEHEINDDDLRDYDLIGTRYEPFVDRGGQRWHKVCFQEGQRINSRMDEEDVIYDPQEEMPSDRESKSLWQMKKISGKRPDKRCPGCGRIGLQNSRCRSPGCNRWISGKPISEYEGSWAEQEEKRKTKGNPTHDRFGRRINTSSLSMGRSSRIKIRHQISKHANSPVREGIVQRIRVPSRGFGEQYTTIDGKTYITYFDFRDPKLNGLKHGSKVRYTTSPGPTKISHSPKITSDLGTAVLLEVINEQPKSTIVAQTIPDDGFADGGARYTDEEMDLMDGKIQPLPEEKPKKRHVRVTFDDGEIMNVNINGTKDEIERYYLSNDFVLGDEKTMHRPIKVDFIKDHGDVPWTYYGESARPRPDKQAKSLWQLKKISS